MALALSVACAAPKLPETGPSLILITLDTLRADRVGAYGSELGVTPELDRLAARGVRFSSASAPAPLTLPSHATMFTGRYPPRHGLRQNGQGSLPADIDTLAQRLATGGYDTAAFVGAFVLDSHFGLDRGFGVYDDDIPLGAGGSGGLEAERPARQVVDRALAWLAARPASGKPIFLWVHLYDAHAPYAAPEPFRSRHPEAPYDAEVEAVDAEVGRLLEGVGRMLPAERTLIAVAADHGEGLGDHGEAKHGLLLYEAALHVPWILVEPGRLPAGFVVTVPATLVDLGPTLAGLCGQPWAAAELDGRDLSSSLLSRRQPEMTDVYAETEYPSLYGWSPIAALRRGSFKWIAGPRPELFDLDADPAEARNLFATERRRAAELDRALERARADTRVAEGPEPSAETRARLAALGYVSGSSAGSGPRPDPRERIEIYARLEAAREAMEAGQLELATAELVRLVRAEPANPVLKGTLAEALRRRGDSAAAAVEHARALTDAPDDAQGWYNLAAALAEAGRSPDATWAVRESIRLDSRRADAWNLLGVVQSSQGEVTDAIDAFRSALEVAPNHAGAATNLGHALRELGRFAEADWSYRRALELAPGSADAENGLGALEIARERPEAALSHLERALQLAPRRHEIRLNRAIALDLLGRRELAAVAYREFLAATAGDVEFDQQRRAANELLGRLEARNRPSAEDQARRRR